MKSLVRFTIGQTVFINLIFILLMVVGVFCMYDLPVERYPNVHIGKVIISAFLPGASPEEVEALVTREIEDALDDLENVEYVRSRSYRERASILVKFLDDTDYKKGFDELRFKVLNIQNDLPSGMDPPSFIEIQVSEFVPAVVINLTGNRENRALSLIGDELKISLQRIPGVKEVELQGEYTREFHVTLDPEKLIRYRVVFDDVAKALEAANVTIPAGDFTAESGDFVIVVDERFRTPDQVANTVIRRDKDGAFVTVRDVMSTAQVSYRDPHVITSTNSRDSVALRIIKSPSGNALDIVNAVEDVLAEYAPLLAKEGVDAVLTQDQRMYIDDALSTLGLNLLAGIILVLIIMWLVMGFRNAMLTTVGIPFSFLVTMTIMWLTGNSLNEITLFSFVLVSGIIVDDAIVVVENVYRHVQKGVRLKDAVIDGTSEVAVPVISATATTVAAFLPMLIMTGSTGEFFAQIPKAVSYALIASLVECLFILPSHILDWPGNAAMERGEGLHFQDPKFLVWLKKRVDGVVCLFLRHRLKSLAAVFLVFLGSLVILGLSLSGTMNLIRIKFFPDDYNIYYVEMFGPVATPIEETDKRLKDVSAYLASLGPGMVKSADANAGLYNTEDHETFYGANTGFIAVELPVKENQIFPDSPKNDPVALLEYMRHDLQTRFQKDGWKVHLRAEKGGPPAGKDVNVRILGPDVHSVEGLGRQVLDFLKNDPKIAPWLIDLGADDGEPNRVFRFSPLRERIAEYDLTPRQVATLAGSVLDGRFVGEYRLSDEDVDLRLKIDPKTLHSPEDALSIPIFEHDFSSIRLGDLVTVSTYIEPGQKNRFQGQRAITVTANIKPGAPISGPMIVRAVKKFHEKIAATYPGASLNFAGEFESTAKSYTSLAYAFFLSILIIYMILATQFQSYTQPVIILSAVVFALTGVILGTFLTRSLFTVNSFIATVGVTGVVVNDSLVLIDFINRLYASGMPKMEAIREGVRIRLRPILLTTLTTTLGLLPMALGLPKYSLVWGTMATTFVTGLCTATALTIVIIPVEWSLLISAIEWGRRKKNSKNKRTPEVM